MLRIVDRLVAELIHEIVAPFREVSAVPSSEGTRIILSTFVGALDSHADLLRAVVDQVPRFSVFDGLSSFEQRVADFTYHQLVANQDRLHHTDLEITTWFIVQTTAHLSIRYVIDRPPIPRERFIDELTGLLLRYTYKT